MSEHKFSYDWTLKDATFTKDKGTVFSTFSCGGGSTMGYKLAGFDVIGNLELDPKKNNTYVRNHHPKYNFLQDIREFKNRTDLPEELYHLDILDGSPPCLAFSTVGDREASWGVDSKREGVKFSQTWDDLFFELCDLARILQPKVVIAENVKGMLLGNAIEYVRGVHEGFSEAGYYCQHFLLDASKMGVPQRRERVIFICLRKDLAEPFLIQDGLFDEDIKPYIDMTFNEPPIFFGEVADYQGDPITSTEMLRLWGERKVGDTDMRAASAREGRPNAFFSQKYVYDDKVCSTLTAHHDCQIPFDHPRWLSKGENCRIATYPSDYDFGKNSYWELCGRAVPPVMMAQIATRVYEEWLSNITE